MVGLGSCDNTADTDKPISTATQTALTLKAPLASPAFTGTVTGITSTMVGLGNCNNTTDANKPISTATQAALTLNAPLASPAFTGTVTGITSTMVGLGLCNNTADVDKPISTATQTALALKATLASPAFTGLVTSTGNVGAGTTTPVSSVQASGNIASSLATGVNLGMNPTTTGNVNIGLCAGSSSSKCQIGFCTPANVFNRNGLIQYDLNLNAIHFGLI
jgi:hypothetical protein